MATQKKATEIKYPIVKDYLKLVKKYKHTPHDRIIKNEANNILSVMTSKASQELVRIMEERGESFI